MGEGGLNKLYWGFVFILINFRIQGFDIFPDTVGYLLFAYGFGKLASDSTYFSTAAKYNIPLIFLSIFSIYQNPTPVEGINFGPWGAFGIVVVIASFILDLLVVYNLFMGIREMAEQQDKPYLSEESGRRWNFYRLFKIASISGYMLVLLAFIPMFAIFYIIVLSIFSIILVVDILNFMKRCRESLIS